jgi:hypothetical protein
MDRADASSSVADYLALASALDASGLSVIVVARRL